MTDTHDDSLDDTAYQSVLSCHGPYARTCSTLYLSLYIAHWALLMMGRGEGRPEDEMWRESQHMHVDNESIALALTIAVLVITCRT